MEVMHLRIDENMFAKALQKQVPEETIKILGITNRCISDKGVNFLSDMTEVSVKYTVTSKNRKTKSERFSNMIVKIEPTDRGALDLVRQQEVFLTELTVLRDILPRINEVVGRQIGPRLWYGCEDPPVLIMENLIRRKFAMKDRQKGLSFEHCRLVVERIAKLHAGSVAVFEQDPGAIELFRDSGILSKKCPKPFFRMMEVSLLRIGKEIQTWADKKCAESGEKLIKLADTIQTQCSSVYDCDSDEFYVLNHGDCWINNIMFKENEKGHPIDLLLVDYQFAVYTSPAIDLFYFLNICPEFGLKYDKDDYFLEVYLNTLQETMQKIGCKRKPPTMEQLKEAMHKRRIYAVFAGIVLYLRMMANTEDTEDFYEVLNIRLGETRMDVFKNPDAVTLAHKMIPIMNQRGYFD